MSICGGRTGPGRPKSRPELGLDLDRQLPDSLGFEQRHPELPRTESERSQDVSEEPEDSVRAAMGDDDDYSKVGTSKARIGRKGVMVTAKRSR